LNFSKIVLFSCFILLSFIEYAQKEEINESFIDFSKKSISKFEGQLYLRKAIYFFQKEEIDSSLYYTTKSIQLDVKNANCLDFVHYYRGYSFQKKKLFKKAKEEFLQISNRFPAKDLLKNNLGQIALYQEKYRIAINQFNLIQKHNRFEFVDKGLIYNNLGSCYLMLSKYDSSEYYFLKSLPFIQKGKNLSSLIESYINIANLYYLQYKDDQAIEFFTKAYELSRKHTDVNLKVISTMNMAVVEENSGDLKSALAYRKESEQWTDSLNNQNKIWDVAQAEKKFEIQVKQKQIDVLKLENRIKQSERNGFITSSILLLILILTGAYFYRLKIKNSKIILLQKNELDKSNATKDRLLSIVSHDLRSSVNALKNSNQKILKKFEAKNFEDMEPLLLRNSNITNSSYNLLDNVLHWAQQQNDQLYFHQENIYLSKIVEQVAFNYKYIFLEKEISFSFNIPADLMIYVDIDSLKIILRNFIDNAIKFTAHGGEISMSVLDSSDAEFVHLMVEDSGIGMSQEIIDKLMDDHQYLMQKNNKESIGTGLGFQLCKSMLLKNGGKLARIESEVNIGTKIILFLPKAKLNE
jgi:signal transduction histidine kinase